MEKSIKLRDLRAQAENCANETVTIAGWVRTIRRSKNFSFMEVSDGSCFGTLQVVLTQEETRGYEEAVNQNVGAAVLVTGKLVLTPQAQQPFEIHAASVLIEGESAPEFPIQKKRHSMEFLREQAHLRPRTNTFQAVLRVRSIAAYAIHKFFQERNFVYVHTPILTTSDCEGAGEMFRVTTLDMKNVPKTPSGEPDFA